MDIFRQYNVWVSYSSIFCKSNLFKTEFFIIIHSVSKIRITESTNSLNLFRQFLRQQYLCWTNNLIGCKENWRLHSLKMLQKAYITVASINQTNPVFLTKYWYLYDHTMLFKLVVFIRIRIIKGFREQTLFKVELCCLNLYHFIISQIEKYRYFKRSNQLDYLVD